MSFNDMLESGRGPGVIGMLMALAVLAIFGLLYVFAFDEKMMGGGPTIESVIRDQAREIEDYRNKLIDREKDLAKTSRIAVVSQDLSTVNRRKRLLEDKIASVTKSVLEGKNELVALSGVFETYKDQYRNFVRDKAKGEILPQLETQSGSIYKNVNIREVTAVGMQIRHDEGLKRIPFEDLPKSMIDYYQFDAAGKAAALAQENVARNEHETSVAVANNEVSKAKAQQKGKETSEKIDKITRDSAVKSSQIQVITDEIRLLEGERARASAAASSARAAGRIHMDQTSIFDSRIRAKQNQISALQAQIDQMRESIQR